MYFSSGTQLAAALAALPAGKAGQFLAFDALYYSNTYMLNGNTTAMTAIEHFVQIGAPAMAKPNASFDPAYYKAAYADLVTTSLNAADLLYHFMQFGLDEGRAPNAELAAKFDASGYLATYPAVADYVNANLSQFGGSAANGALAHYVKFGMAQGFKLPTAGTTFTLTGSTVAGVKSMVLTGDQDVRIDFTNSANQIKGLDLNGDGVIANDGKENALNVHPASGYVAVDAYTRLTDGVLNETNLANVFKGDIKYDGTGFKGDGVATNGNIVLGGLGADTILGGIGNDFLAGGGVASSNTGTDTLSGGRNADFFFTELSLLDKTDGNNLTLDGGITADDNSAGTTNSPQDTDWLLLQASDDDEPVQVVLEDHLVDGNGDGNFDNEGVLATRAGQKASMKDVENLDASGNTYGFLTGLNATVGGAPVNANNNGIGASAQLNITTETGSTQNNIIIGGYDNDAINAGGGNDLLMGGNLKSYANDGVTVAHQILDANLVGLTGNNDGRDELTGGAGADNIVFEADNGIIEGGARQNVNDDAVDTLWLTQNSLGAVVSAAGVTPVAASALTTDNTLRFDLGSGKLGGIDNYSGYGGAGDTDKPTSNASGTTTAYTADQTNYISESTHRVQVQDMDNVVATGLGAIDYKAAGANTAADLTFQNQQNFQAYNGNLDLRGTDAGNTLYAAAGADMIEGRQGNDLLSGGDGVDSFVFNLGAIGEDAGQGDGHDVIWRQSDVNGDNLWDVNAAGKGDGAMARIAVADQAGLMEADFGKGTNTTFQPSKLTVDFTASDLVAINKFLIDFSVKIGDSTFAITSAADLATLKAATNATEVAAIVNSVFSAIDGRVTASASGNVLTITDAATATASGRAMTNISVAGTVTGTGETFTNPVTAFVAAGSQTVQDKLIFAAYNDRADGELVDDAAIFGGDTLGTNNYAQDLVVGFNVDGSTVIAERQSFRIDLQNLAVEDAVTVSVNGVTYSLTVGRALDNSLIAGETTGAFAVRLAAYIDAFLDDDSAAGKVNAGTVVNGGNTGSFVLTQKEYALEETVFMNVGVNVADNSSNGEGALGTVTNTSSTDITLYKYDGRNAGLNATDVLFVGDSGVGPDGTIYSANSRAILATAANAGGKLLGSDAIVVNVTGDAAITSSALEGVDGVAISFNAVANPTTGRAADYAIHGDDQLFGGNGADIVSAGTGDDRVYGSLGLDKIDGGKDLYLVDGVIRVLNDREETVVDAIPATLDIHPIADGAFNDTLVYQQSDFGTVGAGGSTFNIALDLSALQANGGAGRVITNGAAANTTLFTNMENIRTVSGNGTLAGQGNDTLDLSISVDPITGVTAPNSANMRYFLTKEANSGGQVQMFTTVATTGDATGAGTLFTKVDGVENVLGGSGTDYLYIDQTESGKNNSFNAGASTVAAGTSNTAAQNAAQTLANGDKIIYQNNATALTAAQLPAVKVAIGAADVDTVTMTNGQLPAGDAPVDTLTGVEFIDIGAVARNVDEADVLDVSALTTGATANYNTGEVLNGAALVSTVVGIEQLEVVTGSTANDTVIVAPIATMDNNAGTDAADVLQNEVGNILIDSYLTYDVTDEAIKVTLDANTTPNRMKIADLRAVTGTVGEVAAAQAAIVDAINQNEFKFNLGTGAADTVDYSKTADAIAAVVDFTANAASQYVLVGVGDGDVVDAGDRIDQLTSVERIVASQGASTLDLTGADQDLKITFSNNFDDTNVASWDASFSAGKFGREVHEIKVANALSGTSVLSTSYIDYSFVDTSTTDTTTIPTNARWTGIEGSDRNETVELSGYEAGAANTINLRGGANKVTYEGTKIEAVIGISAFVAATPSTTGKITATIAHTAVADDHNATTVSDPTIVATDIVTSYSQQNGIATGTLTIKATRGAQDSFAFDNTTTASKLYVFGGAVDATPSINVQVGTGATANSLQLIGFELVQDNGVSNDVYDIVNFASISPDLRLKDDLVTADHDTIKVANNVATLDDVVDDATNISLAGLRVASATNNTYLSGDFNTFDVLDVTNVTGTTITSVTGTADLTDELVVGALPGIVNVSLFESAVLTNAFVTAYGSSVTLNTTTNTLTAGTKVLTADASLRTVSLGGTALENSFDLASSLAASGNVSVTAVGAGNVTLIGGSGANTLTGAGGDDTLRGGSGNDILDGGFVAEVTEKVVVTLPGGAAVLTGAETVTIAGVDIATAAGAGIEIVVANNSDADQIGSAYVAWAAIPANNATLATTLALPVGGAVVVSYDAASNNIIFSFNSAAGDIAPGTVTVAGTSVLMVPVVFEDGLDASVQSVAYDPRAESADTYVFEATAALNGVDVINNFNMSGAALTDDVLDFTAFLGAAGSYDIDNDEDAAFEVMTLSGAENIGLFYNSAALTAARVELSGSATIANGDVVIGNNAKAVVLVSGDVDGNVDATNQAYSVYLIQDTDATAGFNAVVTLVGTINSATELDAGTFSSINFA